MLIFLEHKMFDMENGDAADEFAKLGASSNAFTSSMSYGLIYFQRQQMKMIVLNFY
mgnify:CR=1 FL=1